MTSLTVTMHFEIIDEADFAYQVDDGSGQDWLAKSAVKSMRKIRDDDWEIEVSRSYAKKKGWL